MTPTITLSVSAHQDTFCRDNLPPPELWPVLDLAAAGLAYPDRLNAATALLDATVARLGPDRNCISADERFWSYGELLRHANQIAAYLTEDLGLVPGNRVLLRGVNTARLAACWLGVLKAGGVVVTTMAMLRTRELQEICRIAEPVLALVDHRSVEELAAAEVAGLRLVTYGSADATDLDHLSARHSGQFSDVQTAADDVAMLAFTSGTTGTPKATMHFHRDLLAIADTYARHVVQLEPDDVVTGTPPLAFTFGLGGLLIFPLRAGACMVPLEPCSPSGLAEAIGRYRATVLFTAPTAYRALVDVDRPERLNSLRRCFSAGEPLPIKVWMDFQARTGISIQDGIGSTEMLHVFIGSSHDRLRPGATGRPVPGYRARVVDDRGGPVPAGVAGNLAVQGPTGCRYLRDPRQRDYVRDGWNLTGDTYICDDEGWFWYQARADDMIVSAGYNIAGPEVEAALLEHSAVQDCAVVGLPDERRGTVVAAFVVLRSGLPAVEETAEHLKLFVKGRIAPYKYPRVITFVDTLPRTTTGKLQRQQLARPSERS